MEAIKRMGEEVILIFPCLPPSELMPNRLRTLHWAVRARVQAEARQEGFLVAMEGKDGWTAPEHAVISYEFHWKDKRKRDLDNLVSGCKAWLDGIVQSGVLLGDDAYHLSIGSVTYSPGKNETVITIEAK